MNIGEKIKKKRKDMKIKQIDLAKSINKSVRMLQKYENNSVTPNFEVLKDIANALNINVTELMTPKYELEEALINGSDNISSLVDKFKKSTKEESIRCFHELTNLLDWNKFKNESDDDIYSVLNSVELYAYLQGLFDMQKKENE